MSKTSLPGTKVDSVKSAGRFADILEFVADSAESPTFAEIAAGLSVPKSSLFHLLATLTARGYLQQAEERNGYQLGPSVSRLASRMQRPASYANRAQPVLKELAAASNETCSYYELHDDEVEVVRTQSGQQPLTYRLQLGDRAPLYCVSAGKILLAYLSNEKIQAYLARTQLRAFTPNTLKSSRAVTRELQEVRRTGFAYSREEYALGVVGIATSVHSRGRVVGALSVAMPVSRHTSGIDAHLRRALTEAASAIERNL